MKINNRELNVHVIGDGTPFVWAHGLMGNMALEDSNRFLRWETFADIIKLVRYDARGHGLSEASYRPEDYHWSNLAEDMVAIADALNIKKFIAGGQSMGCATSLYAALAAPERVMALVLVNPPTAWETRADQGAIYEQLAGFVEAKGVGALRALMKQQSLLPAWLSEANPEINMRYQEAMQAIDEKALPQIFRGAKRCDLPVRENLKSLKAPALILAWVDDPTHPLTSAEELDALLPESQLVIANDIHDLKSWSQRIRAFVEEKRV